MVNAGSFPEKLLDVLVQQPKDLIVGVITKLGFRVYGLGVWRASTAVQWGSAG